MTALESNQQNPRPRLSPLEQSIGEMILVNHLGMIEIGETLVKAIEIDPDTIGNINRAYPQIGMRALYGYLRIGRKELHPGTIDIENEQVQRLVQALPYDVQVKVLTEKITVLLADKKELDMSVFDMSNLIAKQVFHGGKLHETPAQRAYREEQALKRIQAAMPIIDTEYKVLSKNCVQINGPCKLTRDAVRRILDSMIDK